MLYDVLQAAVTVIWCISMVVLFVDVVITSGVFLPRYEETRLARPAALHVCGHRWSVNASRPSASAGDGCRPVVGCAVRILDENRGPSDRTSPGEFSSAAT
jgi:hypothetical protein